MNSVSLIGRLTRDPELRYTSSGTPTVRFTLAVDRRLSKEKRREMESQNRPTADFISVVAWGAQAETIANYLQKGRQVGVTGRIETGSYERDGQRVYTTDVVLEGFTFIGGGNEGGGRPSNAGGRGYAPQGGNFSGGYAPQGGGFAPQSAPAQRDDQTFYPIDNDDVPF